MTGPRAPNSAPAHIVEGQPVRVQIVRGEPRFHVLCPECTGLHLEADTAQCSKRRSMGARQTGQFGEREPLAYLGVWLAAARSHSSRDSHMAFKPSPGQVRAYMRKYGWL